MKYKQSLLLLIAAAAIAVCPLAGCSSKSSSNSEGSSAVSQESSEGSGSPDQDSQQMTGESSGSTQDSPNSDDPGNQTEPVQTSVITEANGSTRIVTVTTAQSTQNPPASGSSASEPQNQNRDITVAVDQVKAKAGQERVPVSIRISNNTGFATGGLTVHFDENLHPVTTDSAGTIEYVIGEEMKGILNYGTSNENDGHHLIAFAFFNQYENITANGTLMTFYMNVPANAASGTVYKLKLDVDNIKNIEKKALQIESIDGSITIE